MNKKLLILLLFLSFSPFVMAQRAALSMDVFKGVMATPNISAEILLAERFTFNVESVINPFDNVYSNISTKQITVSPEVRYWFKRPLYSHFVGVGLMGSNYNVRYNAHSHKGHIAAIGATYGYSFYVSPHWSFTPTIGFGYGYGEDSTFENGRYVNSSWKGRPTITKLGFYFSYIIN